MNTWQYAVSKAWLAVRHPRVHISRCSFHSIGKGWLINLSLPVNRITPNYSQDDAIMLHTRLEGIAVSLAWMLGPDDAIQFVSGEDATPRQFFKQDLKKEGGKVKVSERQTIIGSKSSSWPMRTASHRRFSSPDVPAIDFPFFCVFRG
jgi:hypothetical protein